MQISMAPHMHKVSFHIVSLSVSSYSELTSSFLFFLVLIYQESGGKSEYILRVVRRQMTQCEETCLRNYKLLSGDTSHHPGGPCMVEDLI